MLVFTYAPLMYKLSTAQLDMYNWCHTKVHLIRILERTLLTIALSHTSISKYLIWLINW